EGENNCDIGKMGIAQLARARKCIARYNHVLLFLTKERLNEFAASNKWSRLRESQRKTKGGLAIYYHCGMEKQRGGRCRHKMIAIQRPEGCFVAKTTDGGAPHNHKVPSNQSHQQQHNDPSPEVSQTGNHEGSILASKFEAVCSLEDLNSSEQLITTTPTQNEYYNRTSVLRWNANNIISGRWDEAVTNSRKETIDDAQKSTEAFELSRRYSLESAHLPAPEKSLRMSEMDQNENKSNWPEIQQVPARSASWRDACVQHHRPIIVPTSSREKRISSLGACRRSLQPYSSRIHARRRHSWSGYLFEEAPRDLLRKVKTIRDQQIRCKADDLDKIAVELFTKLDCRRQSELLAIYYGN
uniref:Uncharacterized protein n=1 Tax=Parascaris univalens TaxID=6257 RepID=A0A915ANE0_PARUN